MNVSPLQLASDTVTGGVLDALARHGVLADLLEIEITEGTAITDISGAAVQLPKLIDAGVGSPWMITGPRTPPSRCSGPFL